MLEEYTTDDDLDHTPLWQPARPYQSYSSTLPSSASGSEAISPPPHRKFSSSTYPDPPPFPTPPKLDSVETILLDNPGTAVANLRNLAVALARDGVFGKQEMAKCSLSGRKGTASLDEKKMRYIRSVVQSRVPNMADVEFEYLWGLCRASISKSCQTLRNRAKRKLL